MGMDHQQQDAQNSDDRNARTIFARNISWNATADDFRNIPEFAQALDIKLPTDRETGRPRGFGFIEFATADECAKALANAQVVFDGREVIWLKVNQDKVDKVAVFEVETEAEDFEVVTEEVTEAEAVITKVADFTATKGDITKVITIIISIGSINKSLVRPRDKSSIFLYSIMQYTLMNFFLK